MGLLRYRNRIVCELCIAAYTALWLIARWRKG